MTEHKSPPSEQAEFQLNMECPSKQEEFDQIDSEGDLPKKELVDSKRYTQQNYKQAKYEMSEEYESMSKRHTGSGFYMEHVSRKTEFDKQYRFTESRKPGKVFANGPTYLYEIVVTRSLPTSHCTAFHNRLMQSGKCQPVKIVFSLFPILRWLPEYEWKRDFLSDVISGFTVAIMHIPQGMAYALLGGVPPIVGLYMAFFPVLIYVMMGTSRHVSMGTFAVVCMMASKPVLLYSSHEKSPSNITENLVLGNMTESILLTKYGSSGGYTPIQVGTAVCFVVGLWQVILGICRLGVLSVLLSDTLVSGFTTGAAVHVLTSQVKNLLGLKIKRYSGPLKIIYTYIDIFKHIHHSNWMAIAISAVAVTALSLYNETIKPRLNKKLPIPFPIELTAIIVGTLTSTFANLESKFDVAVVGEVPTGLPAPALPPFGLIPNILIDGLIIAVVAFSVNMSMATILAQKMNYSVNANQELLASGISNMVGSFFSCLPFTASLSRSLIQQTVGGKTQLASVVSCCFLLLVLLLIGPFFRPLPNCILASIVVVALKNMFMQIKDLPAAWKYSHFDGLLWILTFLGVVLLDIDYGLGVGIALSLIHVVIMGQRPQLSILGHVPGENIYLDLNHYQAAVEIPGIRIIHISGGLHFANKDYVKKKLCRHIEVPKVDKLLNANTMPLLNCEDKTPSEKPKNMPESSSESYKLTSLIVDMMSVCFIDPAAVKMLSVFYKDLKKREILFCLANCSVSVYEKLMHCDFFEDFPDAHVFPSIHDAVLFSYQQLNQT